MSLDVSEAIELARDLLKTSCDFRVHDRELAEQFAGRAFEICDDLGIDRDLIGESSVRGIDEPADDDDAGTAVVEMSFAEAIEEETQETNQQLRDLLQQQARVLQNVRETESTETKKPSKWSLKLFGNGRSNNQEFGTLQSAST